MSNFRSFLIVIFAFLPVALTAQNSREYISKDVTRSAGFYHSYEVPQESSLKADRPKGYKPFYISHYSRHGSRWHASEARYFGTLDFFERGDSLGVLTQVGKQFLKDLRIIASDAEGHLGDLSPRGTREHKGIADRMYRHYPEVFHKKAVVDSRSSVIVRCVLSMAAFDESLKEHEPSLQITRESSKKTMSVLCHSKGDGGYGRELAGLTDSLRKVWIDPNAFMNRLFKDGGSYLDGKIRDGQSFMYDCFELAGIMQCCDYLGMNLYYIFSEDEIYNLWKYLNAYAYSIFGPSIKYGDCHLNDAKVLLRDFVEKADEVMDGRKNIAATLRFGHDSNIIPLVSLMEVKSAAARVKIEDVAEYWNISEVSPMAANLQLIFFKNRKGDVKVRVLYNEKDAQLPIAGGPFYDWTELRSFLVGKYTN